MVFASIQSGLCLYTLYKTKQKIWHLYSFYTNLEKKIHWGFFFRLFVFHWALVSWVGWEGSRRKFVFSPSHFEIQSKTKKKSICSAHLIWGHSVSIQSVCPLMGTRCCWALGIELICGGFFVDGFLPQVVTALVLFLHAIDQEQDQEDGKQEAHCSSCDESWGGKREWN